jgi:hypothetical protein
MWYDGIKLKPQKSATEGAEMRSVGFFESSANSTVVFPQKEYPFLSVFCG